MERFVNTANINFVYLAKFLPKGMTCLWEYVVCSKGDFDEWHKKECLYGNCLNCGGQKLYLCLEEKNGIDE